MKNHTIMRKSGSSAGFNNDRGYVLLMTLGVLLLMLMLGLGFMFSAVTERQVAASQAETTKASNLADSGLQRGLAILNKHLSDPGSPVANSFSFSPLGISLFDSSGYYTFPAGGDFSPVMLGEQRIGSIKVEIINRTGKLDPNWWGRPSKCFRMPSAGPNMIVGDADDDPTKWDLIDWCLPSVGWSPVGMVLLPVFEVGETPTQYIDKNNRLFVADSALHNLINHAGGAPGSGLISDLSAIGKADPTKWFSRDQGLTEIKKALPTVDFSQNSDPSAADFNRDFVFPYSPLPIAYVLTADGTPTSVPDPGAGGSNTFIDWGASWRDLTAVTSSNIRTRVPVEALANLDFSSADGTGDVKFANTVPVFGAAADRGLGVHLPWFRALKAQRATDMASYYELVANIKDYMNPSALPTTNLWPVDKGFTDISALSNDVSVVPYPYCGNKTMPNLSEIRFDFDTLLGVKTMQTEIVNFYPEQFATTLINLAEVIEIEFTDGAAPVKTYIQKFIVGFGKSSDGSGAKALDPLTLSNPTMFKKLGGTVIPPAPGLTGPVKVTRLRFYLVQNAGIGDKIGTLSEAQLDTALRDTAQTSLLDVSTLNMATPISVFFASSNALGSIIGDYSVDAIKWTGYGDLKNGDIYYLDNPPKTYGTIAYIVMEKIKPTDVDIPMDPQPVRETPYSSKKPMTTTFTTALPTSRWLVADGQLYVNPVDGELMLRWTPADINLASRNPPPAGKSLWTCTSIFAAGSSSVYLESLDPRCNTRPTCVGIDVWKASTYGSLGTVNSDWWKSVSTSPAWIAGVAVAVGDRFTYNGLDYEVTVAHTTAAANTPDKTVSCYTPVSPSESTGRDYWMGVTKANEDAVAKPANGTMLAKGVITASQMVTTYVRPSTAFVRGGKPWSLWELGAISRAEPWRTIRLVDGALMPTVEAPLGSYEFGDWMLLDELSLHETDARPVATGVTINSPFLYKSELGKTNPNPDTVLADGVHQVLGGLVSMAEKDKVSPFEAYGHVGVTLPGKACPLMLPGQFDPVVLVIPASMAMPMPSGALPGAALISRGELGVRLTGRTTPPTLCGLAMVDWYNVNGVATDVAGRPIRQLDRCREELIGKSINLFQTRYEYFEIVATGRSQMELAETIGGVKKVVTLAEQKASAVVERDTYTGKIRLFMSGMPHQD